MSGAGVALLLVLVAVISAASAQATATPSFQPSTSLTPAPSANLGLVPAASNLPAFPLNPNSTTGPAANGHEGNPLPVPSRLPGGLQPHASSIALVEPPPVFVFPPEDCVQATCSGCVARAGCGWCRLSGQPQPQPEYEFCVPNVTVSFPVERSVFCSISINQYAPSNVGKARFVAECPISSAGKRRWIVTATLLNQPPIPRAELPTAIVQLLNDFNEREHGGKRVIPQRSDVIILGYSADFLPTSLAGPAIVTFHFLNAPKRSGKQFAHDFSNAARSRHEQGLVTELVSVQRDPPPSDDDLPLGLIALWIALSCLGALCAVVIVWPALLIGRHKWRRRNLPFPTKPFTAEEIAEAAALDARTDESSGSEANLDYL